MWIHTFYEFVPFMWIHTLYEFRARKRTRVQRRSGAKWTPSSGQIAGARWRGLVTMHGLVVLFLEVIALAIILLVVGLVVPCVLFVTSTTIMALIVSMMIIWSAIIAIALVALMVVAIFVATVLLVAWFMATCGRNMSRILFLWLLLVLGNLLKNASCLVGCLTLLKEGNHSERVSRHRLVQVGKLVLVCLRLHEKKIVHSSLAPWVHPLFDEGSCPQGSWEAVLGNTQTHASAWEWASWPY